MWPFSSQSKPEWVTHIRRVRKSVYLTDGSVIIAHVQELSTVLAGKPAPENYHFEARARNWDHVWSNIGDLFL